jgi:hypothetical protein
VTAACLLVRRDHFESVGGLDEQNLAVAFNDVDFCLRLREQGLRNVWTPSAELFHHESVSRGTDDTPEKAARFRSEADFMRRRWGKLLDRDPAYNAYMTFERGDMSFASRPRVSLREPWFHALDQAAAPTATTD